MIIYLIILSVVGLFAVLSLAAPYPFRRVRLILTLSCATLLSIFIGLRDQVGADWYTYELIFQQIKHISLGLAMAVTEPGYAICNYFASGIGADIHLVNLICAVLMITGILKFASLVEIDGCLMLFLSAPYLLFVVGMGYTRQAVAIGLSLCAIGFLSRGRHRAFYVLVIAAMCFHYSAAAVLLLYWLRSWRRLLIVGVIIVAALPWLFAELAHPRYGQYLSDESSGVWFRLAIIALGAIAAWIYRVEWRREPILFDLLRKGSIVCLICFPLAAIDSTLIDRLALYLIFVYFIGVGKAIQHSRSYLKWCVLATTGCITYAIFLLWFVASKYAANYWIPYHMMRI